MRTVKKKSEQISHGTAMAAHARWSRRRTVLAALVIALFALLLYLPSLGNEFVWDDVILIGNAEIETLDAATVTRIFTTNFWDVSDATSGMYRPLTILSYYTDYQAYGRNPKGFRLTNLLLNAAVCAMVFLALVEMFARPVWAVAAALFFAAFPMHVESVAWISGRTDVVATLFMLMSLWFYARWRNRGGIALAAGALACHVLALLGKEIAVVLPVLVAVYEWLQHAGGGKARRASTRWPVLLGMCVVTAAYFLARQAILGSSLGGLTRFTQGIPEAVALTFSIVARYALRLFYPLRLNPTPDFRPADHFLNIHTLAGVAVVALAIALVIRWRRNHAFVFGVAVIACGLAPVLHIVPANVLMAEHFLYFPSFGYAILVALAVTFLLDRRRALAAGAFAIALLACSAATVIGMRAWKDDLTLFSTAVATAPDSPSARMNLGVSLAQRNRLEEALAEFRRATELSPDYADAWSAMGRTENILGRTGPALEHCATAVALVPDDARFVNDLGMVQFKAQQYDAAAQSFRRVLELRPRHSHARFNLGLCLYQQSDFEGAIGAFNAIANKDQEFPNAWFFIAQCEARRGNHGAAADAATRFLSLHPADDTMAAQAREIARGGAER